MSRAKNKQPQSDTNRRQTEGNASLLADCRGAKEEGEAKNFLRILRILGFLNKNK